MEADSSHLSREVTPEKDPVPAPETERHKAQTSERVFGSDLTVMEGDYSDLHNLLEQIQRNASSVFQFSLKWKDIDEHFTTLESLLKERTMEVEIKERSLEERFVELEKKEEDVLERERKVELLEKSIALSLEEKERENEMKQCLLSPLLMRLHCETANEAVNVLEEREKEFDLKQKEWIESMSKEAEMVKESVKQLEVREKEVRLRDEAIKEKVIELEKKEKTFVAEQKAKAEEMEQKCKEKMTALEKKEMIFEAKQKAKAEQIDLKEKKLEEREKEVDLKQRELQVRACKRSSEAAGSLIRPAKRHKSHSHEDTDKACEEEEEIVDSEFHDFKNTMSSFLVDKIWALYDPRDGMPRCYAKIKRITKYKSTLDVTWLDPKDDESVPVACGRYTYGRAETVSYLTLSHEVKPIIHGRNISVNPKEGETWALFRDWSIQHKAPYRYDLVEVVEVFEDHQGVGVTYLGKVEGFVSVFKHAVQRGVSKMAISPDEMHRFSHRVPSVRLSGEEKKGVPGGSFELDPAAVPSYILRGEKEPGDDDVVQVGSAKDVPLIILD